MNNLDLAREFLPITKNLRDDLIQATESLDNSYSERVGIDANVMLLNAIIPPLEGAFALMLHEIKTKSLRIGELERELRGATTAQI